MRKVLFNHDGDLLFSCSDDSSVQMFRTSDCLRVGHFKTADACKSIDVSKDSKYLLATMTTHGVTVFNVIDGKILAKIELKELQFSRHVEFALGDK